MVEGDSVHVRTGRISEVSNAEGGGPRRVTIQFDVWDSSTGSSTADVDVADPHLFLITEIGLLRFPQLTDVWFGGMYSPKIIERIRQVASEVQLSGTLGAEHGHRDFIED